MSEQAAEREPATEASSRPPAPGRSRVLDAGEAYALVGLTAMLVAFFAVLPATTSTFPTSGNLQIVLADQAVLLVVALAVLVPMVANVWDFTPGANAGLAAVFGAAVAADSGSIALAVLAALGVGVLVGVLNGLLVTVAKVNSVIATFGMTIVIAGVVQWKTEGNSIVDGIPGSLIDFGTLNAVGIPVLAWVGLAITFAIYYLLTQTPYGRYLYAIGSSRRAAALVGVRVEWLTMSTFVVGGSLAGLAGVLQLARSGAGNPTVGPGFTIPAYAAVFLGAVAIKPGRWNVWGLVVAILFLGVLNSGLNLAGASTYVNNIANGTALLAGVGVANLLARKRGRALTTS